MTSIICWVIAVIAVACVFVADGHHRPITELVFSFLAVLAFLAIINDGTT